jgi:hypothetical protein
VEQRGHEPGITCRQAAHEADIEARDDLVIDARAGGVDAAGGEQAAERATERTVSLAADREAPRAVVLRGALEEFPS